MDDFPGLESGFELALALLPDHIQEGIRSYVIEGHLPGDFLQAVIRNDLAQTVMRADSVNGMVLKEIIDFFNMFVPAPAWGNPEKMTAWHEQGGLKGNI